jgi:hypothetical protein
MKTVMFTLLTLAGLATGLVVGLATMPESFYRSQRHWHLIANTVGGAAAGIGCAAIVARLTGDKGGKG